MIVTPDPFDSRTQPPSIDPNKSRIWFGMDAINCLFIRILMDGCVPVQTDMIISTSEIFRKIIEDNWQPVVLIMILVVPIISTGNAPISIVSIALRSVRYRVIE